MEKTQYSRFELLALAYRKWKRPDRAVIVREAGRESKPYECVEHEPVLPNGFVHVRSAIRALLAVANDLEGGANETTGGHCPGALDRIHEALGELRKSLISRSRTTETAVMQI